MSLWMKSYCVIIQMKATEQYYPVVMFIMLYKVVLTFESVDEILKCDHSNESYWAVLSCGTVYYAVQGGSNYEGWSLSQNFCEKTTGLSLIPITAILEYTFFVFRRWEHLTKWWVKETAVSFSCLISCSLYSKS